MDLATLKASINNDDTMAGHFQRIADEVAAGEREVTFTDRHDCVHNDDVRALTNSQAQVLRDKGYTVDYNKFMCAQWIISGWS